MGDNANVRDREWHNTIVGQGYQARGVVRQPGLHQTTKIVDMTGQSVKTKTTSTSAIESISTKETIPEKDSSRKHKRKEDKKEKSKKSSKHKKHKHEKEEDSKEEENRTDIDRFNPLIQLFLSKFPN